MREMGESELGGYRCCSVFLSLTLQTRWAPHCAPGTCGAPQQYRNVAVAAAGGWRCHSGCQKKGNPRQRTPLHKQASPGRKIFNPADQAPLSPLERTAREDARWAPEARPWGQPCGGRAEPAPRMHLTRPARRATAQASDGLAAVPRGHAAGSRPPPARCHCRLCTAPRPGKGRTPPARHAGQRHRGARAPRGRGGACLWDFGLAGPSLLRGSGPGSVALPRSPATPTH